jgi:hypothetical protein
VRVRLLPILLTLAVCAAAAADRKWQSGTWRDSGDARTYVIVANTFRLHLEDIPAGESRAMKVAANTAVKFVIEGSRIIVLDDRRKEHELRVVRKVDLNYPGVGGGHFIKAVGADGQSVTLEDGSVWEIDTRSWFFTADWQPLERISIRRSTPEDGFNYEIDNTDQDDGALARYSPP